MEKHFEGQVRGVHQMVENERYCVDVLHQISAIQSAMNKVSLALLEDHTHHCVFSRFIEQYGNYLNFYTVMDGLPTLNSV